MGLIRNTESSLTPTVQVQSWPPAITSFYMAGIEDMTLLAAGGAELEHHQGGRIIKAVCMLLVKPTHCWVPWNKQVSVILLSAMLALAYGPTPSLLNNFRLSIPKSCPVMAKSHLISSTSPCALQSPMCLNIAHLGPGLLCGTMHLQHSVCLASSVALVKTKQTLLIGVRDLTCIFT